MQECFMPSLAEIDPAVLGVALYLTKLTSSPKDVLSMFGWNLLRGSWEEDENVKCLQTDGQTHGRQTTGDQKDQLM